MKTLALLVTTGAALTAAVLPVTAATAQTAATKTVHTGHVSISAAAGLPVGATVSVVQHCPAGTSLDRALTREGTPQADPRLRLSSRELWRAGTVARFRVVRAIGSTPALAASAAICSSSAAAGATTVRGTAMTDLRVWGPAPARVSMANGTVSLATDVAAEAVFATAMQAAGADSHPASVQGAVKAVQEVLREDGVDAVAATAMTTVRLRGGEFASMRNKFAYVSDLTKPIAGD